MCGVAVILRKPEVACPATVPSEMLQDVAYRGPDGEGIAYFNRVGSTYARTSPGDSSWRACLGHRRLTILDLTSAGSQPMVYRDKFWISYNGEVYNFVEVRAELEELGHTFRSTSDTEVILGAYAQWGPEAFARLRGMWGLAILDCNDRSVILCRDRFGIKPLYMWNRSGIVAIASEIKQFLRVPGFTPYVDMKAAAEYIETGYESPARTLFRDVEPIPAGSWVRIPLDTLEPSSAESYWHPERVQISVTNAREAGRLFADKLRECVRIHLRSDVPVGCALSGGLDSSSVVMLANELREEKSEPLHTFTSSFPGDSLDEKEYAEAVVADSAATPHYVTPLPDRFLEDLDRFLWIHDEPVGSFSIYAAYAVARLTHETGIKVTLNGQGGDEILAGYWQTYFMHLRDLWKSGRWLELAGHFTGAVLGRGNPDIVRRVPFILRRYRERAKPRVRITFGRDNVDDRADVLKNVLAMEASARRLHQLRVMFLPQLLKWDDRNFMAFSVESRYPFLDHELVELCLSFSPETLYESGWTKQPLRTGLRDALPKKIVERRSKFGFEVPEHHWFSNALRPRIEDWLHSERPIWDHVDRDDVRSLAEYTYGRSGKSERGQGLFRLFVFDRWLDLFGMRFG